MCVSSDNTHCFIQIKIWDSAKSVHLCIYETQKPAFEYLLTCRQRSIENLLTYRKRTFEYLRNSRKEQVESLLKWRKRAVDAQRPWYKAKQSLTPNSRKSRNTDVWSFRSQCLRSNQSHFASREKGNATVLLVHKNTQNFKKQTNADVSCFCSRYKLLHTSFFECEAV